MIDIVIPVYNEHENIKNTLNSIDKNILCEKRVNIIYDNNKDLTLDVIKKIKNKYSFEIRTIKNKILKHGVAGAIKTGIYRSSSKAVLVTMADNSDDYTIVDKMNLYINKGYGVVVPSRFCSAGDYNSDSYIKKILTFIASKSLSFFTQTNIVDWTNNYRMYNRQFIESIDIKSNKGFELGLEILGKAYLSKEKIKEIPCKYTDREYGDSKFKLFKWLPFYLAWYIFILSNGRYCLFRHML